MMVAKPLQSQQNAQKSEDVNLDPRPTPTSLMWRMMVAKLQAMQQQELQSQQKA